MQSQIDLYLKELDKNPSQYKFFPKNIQSIIQIAQKAFHLQVFNYPYLPKELKDDDAIIQFMLNQQGMGAQFLSSEQKNNKEYAQLATISQPQAIQFFSKQIRSDDNLAKQVLEKNGLCFKFLEQNLKIRYDMAIIAVQQNGLALKFLDHFQGNREIVRQAIIQNPLSIQYSSFKSDKDMAMLAVSKNGQTIKYLYQNLINDDEIIKESLKTYPECLKLIDNVNNEYIKIACDHSPHALSFVPMIEKEFIKDCLKFGQNLLYTQYKNDINLIKIAVKTFPKIQYFDIKDEQLKDLLEINWKCAYSIKEQIYQNDQLLQILVNSNPFAINIFKNWDPQKIKKMNPNFDFGIFEQDQKNLNEQRINNRKKRIKLKEPIIQSILDKLIC